MNRDEKILKLKLDIIFKRIFGDVRNEDIIKTFLEDLLELPPKSIQKILIDNVELVPAFIDLKFSGTVVSAVATLAAIQEGHLIRTGK